MGLYVVHHKKGKGIYEVRENNSETPLPGFYSGAHMKQWFEDNSPSSSEEEDRDRSTDKPDGSKASDKTNGSKASGKPDGSKVSGKSNGLKASGKTGKSKASGKPGRSKNGCQVTTWLPKLCLKMEDKAHLETEGAWLNDCHINAAQKLIHEQFPSVSSLAETILLSQGR